MRDLPFGVRVFGHPIVASILTGLFVLSFLGLLTAGPGGVVVGLVLLPPAAWVAYAAQAVKQQRDWRKAWDTMSEPVARSPATRRPWLAVLVGAGSIAYVAANLDQPGYDAALGLMVLVVVAGLIVALAKRLWTPKAGRTARDRGDFVSIAAGHSSQTAPDLAAAYRAVPAHCWQANDTPRK